MINTEDNKTKNLNNVISHSNNIFNLKIEDIRGTNTEVLTIYLYELKNFMNTHDLSESENKLYSALYSSLQYYKEISDPTTPFFQKLLDYTEKETTLLMRRYPNLDIKTSLRIKSPISAFNKILDKIQEYIYTGRDLNNLNTSLRDFIGIRRVVDIKDILFENQKESTDNCYDFAVDQLNIQNKSGFFFIPVGEKKLETIKSEHDYILNPEQEGIYIPSKRPVELDLIYDQYVKDYIAFPKESLYQTLQYCAYLPFSKNYALEYQIRTQYMHNYAEHGVANHDSYKTGFSNSFSSRINQKRFHRANLPIEYTFDSKIKKIRPFSLDESMKSHFGHTFFDRFGIEEEDFYRYFTKEDQDRILSLKYSYIKDEKTNKYKVVPIHTVALPTLITSSPEKLHSSIEKNNPIHSGFEDR